MKLSSIGAVSAALALCAVAGAQTTTNATVGASLRVGFFIPTNKTTNDIVGNGFFAFGADYKLGYKAPSMSSFSGGVSLSVDYFRKDDYGSIPVLLNYNLSKDKWTFSVGAGVGFNSLPDSEDTKFAYQAGVAYDVTTTSSYPIFVQAKFLGNEESKLNGVGVYVGVRF